MHLFAFLPFFIYREIFAAMAVETTIRLIGYSVLSISLLITGAYECSLRRFYTASFYLILALYFLVSVYYLLTRDVTITMIFTTPLVVLLTVSCLLSGRARFGKSKRLNDESAARHCDIGSS